MNNKHNDKTENNYLWVTQIIVLCGTRTHSNSARPLLQKNHLNRKSKRDFIMIFTGTKNSHIEYSIVGGDYKNNFTIDPNLGIITPKDGLDFEQIPGDNSNIRPIHLTVSI